MRIALVICAAMLTACSARPTTVQWNDGAAQEVRSQVENVMVAFAASNVDAVTAAMTADVVAFEIDLENKPVRLGSRDEVARFAQSVFAELKKMGATLKFDIHANNCRATDTIGYCTVEFDARVTMADGTAMNQPTRNSVILTRTEAGWKWTHWHSSPSVAPAPPAK